MLSSVFLSGRMGEIIGPRMRYVEVDRVIPGEGGRYKTDRLPVRTMLAGESQFMRAKIGAFIVLKGRIEVTDDDRIIIVDELDEIFRMPPGMSAT